MNLNKKAKLMKVDEEFAKIIGLEVPAKRIDNKVDNKLRSPREVTKKMMKHPLFPKLVEDLETFKFLDNE
jgi:hypothetical protein